jgi:hypothetical protein
VTYNSTNILVHERRFKLSWWQGSHQATLGGEAGPQSGSSQGQAAGGQALWALQQTPMVCRWVGALATLFIVYDGSWCTFSRNLDYPYGSAVWSAITMGGGVIIIRRQSGWSVSWFRW